MEHRFIFPLGLVTEGELWSGALTVPAHPAINAKMNAKMQAPIKNPHKYLVTIPSKTYGFISIMSNISWLM